MSQGREAQRLEQAYSATDSKPWLSWGPYLSERQWGTVREDYSAGGNAWDYFSHDQARSRAYRWGEDGLAGISDPEQKLCFAIALWNGRDPILKERLFGLTNGEGNHGEDVKEYYFYVDNTPTHSYMKWLYKYPQNPFPYQNLVQENARRKSNDPGAMEYELIDTGIFENDRYFDVQVEYAKASTDDILIKIRVTNHGPDSAPIKILPTLWFRNTWAWFEDVEAPLLTGDGATTITASPSPDGTTAEMKLYCKAPDELLFVDNESNNERLFHSPSRSPYPKDGINDYIVMKKDTVRPTQQGTKACAVYSMDVASQETKEIQLRFSANLTDSDPFGATFETVFQDRIKDADEFYKDLAPPKASDEEKLIQRQAYAGMLWSKQYYHYVVNDWLNGDPVGPPPPAGRDRNKDWRYLYASNVLTMPDTWEYPWFAAWDLCFQTVVFSRIDLNFSKQQLKILAHEWYMSPNGAIPAYEWAFSDINPPLHAWAALQISINEEKITGRMDAEFLEDIFRHCLLNFTWWANRVDPEGNNLFEGGFLGLDNISVINRSNLEAFEQQLGRAVALSQSDGTSWMGMFCLNMMNIALKLNILKHSGYMHLAVKFFQHYLIIADAINGVHETNGGMELWDESEGFYYDYMKVSNPDDYYPIKLRSLVGIIALFPVTTLDMTRLDHNCTKAFHERMEWFMKKHPELLDQSHTAHADNANKLLLSFANPDRLRRILAYVFDESEFLSPHGIRGISKKYQDNPYRLTVGNVTLTEAYAPAESIDQSFGGNSNWRGPIWFPINFMFIDTLRRYHEFLGDDFKVEYPTHSGKQLTLAEIADDLAGRLVGIFEKDTDGNRPVYGGNQTQQKNPTWKDLLLFYEYFHGDNGAGLGASHQTGWTGLVAELIATRK